MSERFNSAPSAHIDVDSAFDPEKRQAQADLDAYLESRPYKNEDGEVVHPETGEAIDFDAYMDQQREDHYDETNAEGDYSGQSLAELAERAAKARETNDKTAQKDAEDAFFEKFSAYSDKYGWSDETIDSRLARYSEVMYGESAGNDESTQDSESDTEGGAQSSESGQNEQLSAPQGETTNTETTPETNNQADEDSAATDESQTGNERASRDIDFSQEDLSMFFGNSLESGVVSQPSLETGAEDQSEDSEEGLSADDIKAKRAAMVAAGLRALDVGNMTDEQIANYKLVENKPQEEEVVPLQNENDDDEEVEPLQNENDEEEVEPLQNENDEEEEVVPLQNEQGLKERLSSELRYLFKEPLTYLHSRFHILSDKLSDKWESLYSNEKYRRNTLLGTIGLSAVLITANELSRRGFDVPSIGGGTTNATANIDPSSSGGLSGFTEKVSDVVDKATDAAEKAAAAAKEKDRSEAARQAIDKFIESLSEKALTKSPGEGGFQTLQEMGVPQERHEEVWEQVGRALESSDSDDKVYRMKDGRWGWGSPGKLDDKTLKIIAEIVNR